ncbi:FAD-dependent monooxygenase [Taklimakanibacter deserti]|uniref:FAD-dependent monooxygenase n=1 Tax=Taklimakanibacter deserti TaxID=2267839 RepID=UPI000E650327
MPSHPILIAGGGIAGLASALALTRSGRAARLLEKAGAFETVGAGLQIGPNAVRALKYLDVWECVAPASFAPPRILIRDGHSGRILQEIALGAEFERRFGEPYRVIHRADLLAGLAERAKQHAGIELAMNAEVTSVADKGGYVEITTPAGSERGEALLGADGIRSAVRRSLGQEGALRKHDQILHRALTSFDRPMPEHLAAITLWLCRRGHVVHYPVRGGKALNIVAAMDGRWESEDWSAPAARQEIMAHFAKIHPDLFQVLAISSPWHKWAAADLAPVTSWSRNRTTLIGDAAHAALPYLAQGAAMALEDAVTLARAAERADSIAHAFSAYEALRKPRTRRIAQSSLRLARAYHAGGPLRIARNAVLRMTDPARFLDRMAWIYDFDPRA